MGGRTRYVLNDRCPWPERRGLEATVVDTTGCGHRYPVHGVRPQDVVVFIEVDPIGNAHELPNGEWWSCVVERDDLTPIEEDASNGR